MRTIEVAKPVGVIAGAEQAGPAVTPSDLAELMASFTEVTTRLESTHAVLRGEVSRLSSELRDANERLRRSKRLAELGEMAAGIAHEIRNPLGSISLYSEILAQDMTGEPAETAYKIGKSVRRLDAIVRDVLDFARDLKIRPEPIDTDDLIEAVTESPRLDDEARGSAGVRVRIESGAEVIRCDRSLGMQALLNVVENARQANGGRGDVELHASRVRFRTSSRESVPGVSLGVRDHGPGIDAEVLERMFNPFFTTRETGTGLGLAIVHRIVDAHGGVVIVRNNRDIEGAGPDGATVELCFPDSVEAGRLAEPEVDIQQETERSV